MTNQRMSAYARDEESAIKLREHIQTLPDNLMEELKTQDGSIKFEFYGTMLDGVQLMGLGAATCGKM